MSDKLKEIQGKHCTKADYAGTEVEIICERIAADAYELGKDEQREKDIETMVKYFKKANYPNVVINAIIHQLKVNK